MPDITKAAIALPPNQAVEFLKQKLAVPTEHWTDVWKQAHARSFMVAGAASQALVEDFHAEVIRAIENGTTLADFRKQFDRIVEKHGWVQPHEPGWRANIIYETNLSMAYAAGNYAEMTRPATLEVFPFWQYVHSGSRHPRVQHLAWNGLTLRADDPFWDTHYPPNGWHCGCRVRPLMRSELARMGKDAPDIAPPLETRPWTNRHTGQTHQVPIGIDPGFDYNVGKAWKGPVPTQKAELRIPPPAPAKTPEKPPAVPLPHVVPTVPPAPPQSEAELRSSDNALKRAFKPMARALGPPQIDALGTYQGAAYKVVNNALRLEIQADGGLSELIEQMDRVLMSGTVARAVRVHRGVRGVYATQLRQAAVGAVLADPAYSSTSLSQKIAKAFAGRRGLVLEILVREGYTGAAYMPAVPELNPTQYELLLARGARFRVLSNDGERLVLELL